MRTKSLRARQRGMGSLVELPQVVSAVASMFNLVDNEPKPVYYLLLPNHDNELTIIDKPDMYIRAGQFDNVSNSFIYYTGSISQIADERQRFFIPADIPIRVMQFNRTRINQRIYDALIPIQEQDRNYRVSKLIEKVDMAGPDLETERLNIREIRPDVSDYEIETTYLTEQSLIINSKYGNKFNYVICEFFKYIINMTRNVQAAHANKNNMNGWVTKFSTHIFNLPEGTVKNECIKHYILFEFMDFMIEVNYMPTYKSVKTRKEFMKLDAIAIRGRYRKPFEGEENNITLSVDPNTIPITANLSLKAITKEQNERFRAATDEEIFTGNFPAIEEAKRRKLKKYGIHKIEPEKRTNIINTNTDPTAIEIALSSPVENLHRYETRYRTIVGNINEEEWSSEIKDKAKAFFDIEYQKIDSKLRSDFKMSIVFDYIDSILENQ